MTAKTPRHEIEEITETLLGDFEALKAQAGENRLELIRALRRASRDNQNEGNLPAYLFFRAAWTALLTTV
jgi:hypothetical protein